MELPTIYLTKEFQNENSEIYRIMQLESDTMRSVIGFLVIEDCNRPASVTDYPSLIDVYPDGKGFEGSENVLKCHAIVPESLSDHDESVLEHLGISLIEFKPNADTLFKVHIQPKLGKWIDRMSVDKLEVIQEMLLYTEIKPDITSYSEKSLNRLPQF